MRYAVNFRKKVKKLVLIDSMGLGKEVSFLIRLSLHPALYSTIGITLAVVTKSVKQLVNRVCSRLGLINPLPLALIVLGGSVMIFRHEADVWVTQLAAMMIPTLLIWGARDKIVPVSNAYKAARIIPDCKVHVFEDGGHNVHKYKAKELTYLLTEFLT
jgi:4,5:9,10-diseco-3-hydroxy-5,9,17-trioxoandrosta-1(10),2-diene-4-oate hydrolase